MTKITTISLSSEDVALIEQYDLSPTALIKEKLAQFKEVDTFAAAKLRELNEKIKRLAATIQGYADFVESKGLLDEFLGIKQNVVQEKAAD